MKRANYTNILLEEMNAKFDLMLEIVSSLATLPAAVRKLQEDVDQIQIDIRIIKSVVTSRSGQLQAHERRITRLESV